MDLCKRKTHEMNSGSDVAFSKDSDSNDSDTSREACSMQRKPSPLPKDVSSIFLVHDRRLVSRYVEVCEIVEKVALHCSCLVVARQMGWFYEYTQIRPGSREVSSLLDNDPSLSSRCIVTSDVSYNKSMS